MSIIKYFYKDGIAGGTVESYSGQLNSLPAANVQSSILSQQWKTDSTFTILSGTNDIFAFKDTSTESIRGCSVADGEYTGDGLAVALQAAIRAAGEYTTQTVSYTSTRFTIGKASSATSLSLNFGDNPDRTIGTILGFDKDTVYSGITSYISPTTTQGCQQWIEFSADEGFSSTVCVIDNHNLTDGTVVHLRMASTASYFNGLYKNLRGDGVFQATTNLITDPEDLTTGNWTETDCTATLSDFYYDGKRFTKLTNSGAAAGHVYQALEDAWATLTPSFSVIVKKGSSSGNTTQFIIRNDTEAVDVLNLVIDWDNYPNAPGTPALGTLHNYDWKDSETLEIRIICATLANLNDNLHVRCRGSNNNTANEYTYWTAVQAEDLPYSTPYVNGSRAVVHPDETFEMPSQFTIDMIIDLWHTFDDDVAHRYISWYNDATHFFHIYYTGDPAHIINLFWKDGTDLRWLSSAEFDDGSSHIDINQRIRIIASIDLTTGTKYGSRFIVIPLDSGAKAEDIEWSDAIDVHSSTFSTLSIGHEDDSLQADSQFEYIRIYAGTLVGTVADSDDADALLADMTLSLDLSYRNTEYMRSCETSTVSNFYTQDITIGNDREATLLTSTQMTKAVQLSWFDRGTAYTEIGKIWLGEGFTPTYQATNTISFNSKKLDHRSSVFISQAGASFFDKKDRLLEYWIPTPPLDQYYDSATKIGFENMLDDIGNDEPFYISLDHNISTSTVYVYLLGDPIFKRLKNTTIFNLGKLKFREQK